MTAAPELEVATPTMRDAQAIWRIVVDSGVLDENSLYLYLLLCRDFSSTCLVARQGNQVVGFVTAYRLPRDPDVLFVWQVGVARRARRQGIALQLLHRLVQRCSRSSLRCVEATIAPSNTASHRLFESLAHSLDAPWQRLPESGLSEADFPPGSHEPEPLIRIGPLN